MITGNTATMSGNGKEIFCLCKAEVGPLLYWPLERIEKPREE